MRKKIFAISGFLLLLIGAFFCYILATIPFNTLSLLPDRVNLSSENLQEIKENNIFGKYITCNTDEIVETTKDGKSNLKLNFKLFGLFTLKQIDVNTDDIFVYTGGNVVGFSLNSNGVVVIGNSEVITENGSVDTLSNVNIKIGDIITEIAGEKVTKISDLGEIVNKEENLDKELDVKINRKGEELQVKIKPAKDIKTQKYKLGLWVKDDASGVGTLTYIRKDNKRFGALGHAICDADTKQPFDVKSGDMYNCNVIGINKGEKGKPGELKALFIQGNNSIGTVDKNTKYGIFGVYKEDKIKNISDDRTAKVGGRFTAKPGKAKIRISLDGENYNDYDIEIIKTNYQANSSDKSMVIRVIDKELIKKTGGIVQGMSGSPILQNDKIIGAVTHVFVSDPTKGFGIYLDWMIGE